MSDKEKFNFYFPELPVYLTESLESMRIIVNETIGHFDKFLKKLKTP